MADPDAAIASFQDVIASYEQRLAEAQTTIAEREQRLAQISELAHLEAEQPTEEQPSE